VKGAAVFIYPPELLSDFTIVDFNYESNWGSFGKKLPIGDKGKEEAQVRLVLDQP
jgi:hypothetical protein